MRSGAGALIAILGVLLLAPGPLRPGPQPATPLREAVRSYTSAHKGAILREFTDLLAIPNTATDRDALGQNAQKIVKMLTKRGLRAHLLQEEGAPPAVYGELDPGGANATLAIYAHYDGQPVDPRQWATHPFHPVLRDGPLEQGGAEVSLDDPRLGPEWRLYARGASDDKAPIEGVLAALDALRATGTKPTVRLKLLFEGEEESGSPHLAHLLRANATLLAADCWLLCDGPVHASRRAQVFFGARGTTDLELTVYGPIRALHSGHYGNWAPNPVAILSLLLSSLRDTDGRILIPGFYDDVRPLTEVERQATAALPEVDGPLRQSLQLAATEAGNARLAERILLPALNLRGVQAGAVGEAAANAIPTEARASIDFRLVPDETPESVHARVETFLRGKGYVIVHGAPPDIETRLKEPHIVRLDWGNAGYPPARTPIDLPVSRAVVRVLGEGTEPPLAVPSLGGSIPMYLFQDILKAPVIGVPIANHDNNQHAANENLRMQNLWDGIESYAMLLVRLGPALGPKP
jgi:acetylornithine deacetylase/succinyl-diaminopimelate desuccinylase-like protein